jgi:hypothetical protein
MSVTAKNALENKPAPGVRRYLLLFAGIVLLGMALLGGLVRHDFFSTNDGDASYRDLGGRRIAQIQDEDVFYSNVGDAIASTKTADIVFLGPSFVSFAIDRNTLQSSPLLGRLKIYNMAFIGVRSGEFSRLVINRREIHAPLWIINVDDQVEHFFSDDLNLTIGAVKTPIAAVRRSQAKGYLTVVGRDVRWWIEELIAAITAIKGGGHYSPAGLYRNVSNGDIVLTDNPSYVANDHKPIVLARDPDCHTNPTVVEYARKFLKEVGGNAVFMLVPHSHACVRQAAELATALNVELITPSFDGITSLDGGGHLDKKGAEKFTSYLAAELVKTQAFKRAFAGKLDNLK